METLNIRNRVASIAIQATVGLLAVVALTVGAPARAEAKTKYYLTTGTFQGNAVLTACASGYHMASLWEIRDTSNLQYDTSRGLTQADSGSGPPSEAWGWIRTGSSSNSTGDIGTSNCIVWTTNAGDRYGTILSLTGYWVGAGSVISPWVATSYSCDTAIHVWCVRK
jgi:hypothetical protein